MFVHVSDVCVHLVRYMCNQCSFLRDSPRQDQITTEFCIEFGLAETRKQIEQLYFMSSVCISENFRIL